MSDENTGNGKGPSILDAIRKEWTKAGSKEPGKETKEKAFASWEAAREKRAVAEAALEAAIEEEAITVKALAKLYGARSLRYQGQVYDFASRGERVFFRKKTGGVVDV